MSLIVSVSTANFLPLTALLQKYNFAVMQEAARRDFGPTELLTTRAACRSSIRITDNNSIREEFGAPISSVHEIWNPAPSELQQLVNIMRRRPQSRGMIPYPMDAVFFRNQHKSESSMFKLAETAGVPAVMSHLISPCSNERYGSVSAAIQIHPDLGPGGAYLDLEAVTDYIEKENYSVVLDTHHVRRRQRQHLKGVTELLPSIASDNDKSLGGILRAWCALGHRVRLVHFQTSNPTELMFILQNNKFPASLAEFVHILPELNRRSIPIVIEIGATALYQAVGANVGLMGRFGLDFKCVWDACERIRETIVTARIG